MEQVPSQQEKGRQVKSIISILLCLSIALAPTVSFAEDPPPPAPATTDCKEPLAVVSPCSGVLLPTSAASDGLRCLMIDVPRLTLELEFQKSLWTSRETRYKSLLSAEQERADKFFKLHQDATIAATPSWYEHPIFWFAVGFVVATGTTVGITYAVNSP